MNLTVFDYSNKTLQLQSKFIHQRPASVAQSDACLTGDQDVGGSIPTMPALTTKLDARPTGNQEITSGD